MTRVSGGVQEHAAPLYADPQLTGMVLAIVGNLIISIALNIMKFVHNENKRRAEPLRYTCIPLWWCGLACTIVGEVGNFAAYGFAEASLITPLGAVSVLANAFIAAFVLGEGLRVRDVIGCALCIAGGCIIVFNSPEHAVGLEPDEFLRKLQATPFLMYIVSLIALVSVMLGFQDTYGHRHVAYFVMLCSLLGSVTVMSCKGVSTFLNLWICCGAPSPFAEPVIYLLLLVLGSTAILQVRYLNEAMERFGNTETVPVYYVLFTLTTIMGSNILYRDFENEDRWTVMTFCFGCSLTFFGVHLLTSRRRRRISTRSLEEDDKHASMLANAHACGVATPSPPHMLETEAPLDHLCLEPSQSCNSLAASEGFDEQEQPLTLASTPMGLSGDVLRRTFSSRLTSFAERASATAFNDGRLKFGTL